MSDQLPEITREHHFFVSVAKGLFRHPDRGIVSVRDPIRIADAKRFGLSPLIMYGLAVPKLKMQWLTFSSTERPRSLFEVLTFAWRNADPLMGPPDFLRVNRLVNDAAPGLQNAVAQLGVHLVVADAKEKSLSASLRTAQAQANYIRHGLEHLDDPREASTDDIDYLCKQAHVRFNWRHKPRDWEAPVGLEKAWFAQPRRPASVITPASLDWTPGAWLTSWEASLPPSTPRCFYESDDGAWLISSGPSDGGSFGEEGLSTDSQSDQGEDEAYEFDEGYDDLEEREVTTRDRERVEEFYNADYVRQSRLADLVSVAVACSPHTLKQIAEVAGTTQKAIRLLMSGRVDPGRSVRYRLQDIFGLEIDESTGEYYVGEPCVAIAKTPAIGTLFEFMSHGGDARPFECIPQGGVADPSWRYFFVNSYSGPTCILMAPRGGDITERLPKWLANFKGAREVPMVLYKDVVATCARACLSPRANVSEMKDFVRRHQEKGTEATRGPDFDEPGF